MSRTQPTLWESERVSLERSLALTAESLNVYAANYDHWALAFSGGKDSSALVAAVMDYCSDRFAREKFNPCSLFWVASMVVLIPPFVVVSIVLAGAIVAGGYCWMLFLLAKLLAARALKRIRR